MLSCHTRTEAGIAASVGLKRAMDAGLEGGTLIVLGTPAEEDDGGKIDMIRKGAIEGVDFAMMVNIQCANESTTPPVF